MNTRLRKPKGNRKDGKKFHRRFTVSPKWGTFQARKGKTIPVHLTWNKCYKAATIWQPAFFFSYRFQQKITLLVRLVPFLLEICGKNITAYTL